MERFKKIVSGIQWAAVIAAAVWVAWYFYFDLPDTRKLLTVNPATSAIREWRETEAKRAGQTAFSSMIWRDLRDISPYLRHAVVMAEDDRFYQHNGFDFEQTERALQINWQRKKFAFGASTITQQLARTLYLSPRKSLLRKMKEALITRRLERTLPKKRILELYLNTVEWGPNLYGAEAAARHYFGVSAADLTPNQAVALTVILPSPRRWNPVGETKFVTARKALLYDRMLRANFLPVPTPTETPTPTPEPTPLPKG